MTVTRSPIFLVNAEEQREAPGELLDAITDEQLADWDQQWKPELLEAQKRLRARQADPASVAQNFHWDWERKTAVLGSLLAYSGFSIVCDGVTQGMMLIRSPEYCSLPSQKGQFCTYIDYLETAPWNRGDLLAAPKYKGVGVILVRAAIEFSLQEDFKGRIGLHALPQAESFYLRCGMTKVGQDPHKSNLTYYEMTPEQAQTFIKGGLL